MTSPEETPRRILVIEDEPHLAAGLKLNFELEGYSVEVGKTAREAARKLASPLSFDAIVLDLMLPDMDGVDFCRRIRASGNLTPIIMLTARRALDDRVRGLEAGADDYLSKPFELSELLARVRALWRRRGWDRKATPDPEEFRFGASVVNFDTHDVSVDGKPRVLTQLELHLLRYFLENPRRVISRDELLTAVWKMKRSPNTRTVDNFIVRLRKHFEPNPSRPVHFMSVRGAGYRFYPGKVKHSC